MAIATLVRNAGLALIMFPEVVTTFIGVALVLVALLLPKEARAACTDAPLAE